MSFRTDLIRASKPQEDVFMGDVNTQGIIDTVLYADPRSAHYTKEFAQTIKGRNVKETAWNIWKFLKTEIRYLLDQQGYQWIKSPGRLWKDKAADCKSYSVFTASILKNLGIRYGYRFASYDPMNSDPTHVYVYVPTGDGEIIIDAVWHGPFGSEKPIEHKKDYLMAQTYYLGSTQSNGRKPGTLGLNKDLKDYTDGEMDLIIARQRVEIEKANAIGIGSTRTAGYDAQLAVINQALANIDRPEVIERIGDTLVAESEMIGDVGKAKKKKGVGKFLQKLGKGVKKGVKAVTKVVSAPVRLAAKGMLEIQLPKAAPMFLYLFTPEGITLPTQMARKKKKAEKLKKIIVEGIGMKEKHLMGIIRNALTKQFKKSPESFLAEKLRARVSGIGNPRRQLYARFGYIPKEYLHTVRPKLRPNFNTTFNSPVTDAEQIGAIPAIVGAILKAIQWIVGLFKKKGKAGVDDDGGNITAEDVPDIERDMVDAVDLGPQHNAASIISKGIVSTLPESIKNSKPKKGNFFKGLSNIFENITPSQAEQIKTIASDLLAKKPAKQIITKTLIQSLPFLNEEQRNELTYQVTNGGLSVDQADANDLAWNTKTDGMQPEPNGGPNTKKGGGSSGGFCDC